MEHEEPHEEKGSMALVPSSMRGGGNDCAEDGKELETARGINQQVMQKASWDLSKHVGKKTFIKIVDQSTGGWGHVTADNFQFDGKLLKQYFKCPVQ